MEAQVLPTMREDIPPAPLVQLTMTLEEFTVLAALQYAHLDGHSHVRTGIERGLDDAIMELDPYWRKRVYRGREYRRDVTMIVQVAEALTA